MSIANLDTNFPRFTTETTEEKVAQIQDYLYMLLENLRYTLSNLDEGNWNPTSLSNITEPVKAQIKDIEGNITELQITAQGLTSRVTNAEGNISSLTQTASSLSSRITSVRGDVNEITQTLDGVVFYDSDTGATVIDGSHITTGTISAQRIGTGSLKIGDSATRGSIRFFDGGGQSMWIRANAQTNSLEIAAALSGIILSCSDFILLEASKGIMVNNYGPTLPDSGAEQEGQLFFLY